MVVFGSAVAALLPLLVGIIAIVGTSAVLRAVTGVTDVSIFAQNLTTALGLGLAVDYALLVVRRFREELAGGAVKREAIATTLATAGRTVGLSALTVAVSLGSMVIFPLYFLRSFAYAGIAVVVLAAAAALIVVPAALMLLGPRIDALDVRRVLRRRLATAPAASRVGWRRLTQAVVRRAWIVAVVVVAALIAVGVPFLGVQFGASDHRQLPSSAEPRLVAESIRHDFTSNATSDVDVVVGTTSVSPAYAAALSRLPDVGQVDSAAGSFRRGRGIAQAGIDRSARRNGGYEHLTIRLRRGVEPVSEPAQRLVRSIRAVPTAPHVLVGGQTAELDVGGTVDEDLGLLAAVLLASSPASVRTGPQRSYWSGAGDARAVPCDSAEEEARVAVLAPRSTDPAGSQR